MRRSLRNLLFFLLMPGMFGLGLVPFSASEAAAQDTEPAVDDDGFTPVDFRDWDIVGAGDGWNIDQDGARATRTVNGSPTYIVSPDVFSAVEVRGTMGVNTSVDDDIIGFVFGFSAPLVNTQDTANTEFDHLSFSWKQATQFGAPEGFLLSRVERRGIGADVFAVTHSPPTEVLAARTGSRTGWVDRTQYDFRAVYTSERIEIFIDDEPVFEVDGQFETGRIGIFTSSQISAQFSDFSYRPLDDGTLSVEASGQVGAVEGDTMQLSALATAERVSSPISLPEFVATRDELPEQACPAWIAPAGAATTLVDGALRLSSGDSDSPFWRMPVLAGQDVTVNADLQVRSRSGDTTRGPAAIVISTGNGNGTYLWIADDELFISVDTSFRASERVPIDGTTRNSYSITVTQSGDVSVSVAGQEVLTGSTFDISSFEDEPAVRFGDSSGRAGGVVDWFAVDIEATAVVGACGNGETQTTASDIATYSWQQISGNPVQLSATTVADPTFDAVEQGSYTFRVTATAGGLVRSDVVTVDVANAAPSVEADISASPTDGAVLLTTSFTDPGILDTHEVIVDWGDGSPVQITPVSVQGAGWGAVSVAHVYAAPGSYQPTVTIRDDDGGASTRAAAVTIQAGGNPAPVPGVALWANSGTQESTLRVAGRDIASDGRTNSNNELIVNGDGVAVGSGDGLFTTVAEPLETGRNHVLSPELSAASQAPRSFDVVDYQPGGRAAASAGEQYHDMSSECAVAPSGAWAPLGTLEPGLYWVPCGIDIAAENVDFDGPATFVSGGSVQVTGQASDFPEPFIDFVSVLASGGESSSLKVSGDNHVFSGAVVALNGDLWISGLDHEFSCGAFGETVLVTGQGHNFGQTTCELVDPGTPDQVSVDAPPVIAPNLTAAITPSPGIVAPGGTVTFDAVVSNVGARVVIPALVQLRNQADSSSTISEASSILEVFDPALGEWVALAEGTVQGTVATPAGTSTTGDLAGTVVDSDSSIDVGAATVFELDAIQLESLIDPGAQDVRVRILVESSESLESVVRIDESLAQALADARADASNVNGLVQIAGGTSIPISADVVEPGESVTVSVEQLVPTIERASGESDAAFSARLAALDRSTVAASLSGNAVGAVGPLPLPGTLGVAEIDVPVVSYNLVAPSSVRAGDQAVARIEVTNTGSTAASIEAVVLETCLLYTSPSPRDRTRSRMPSSA